MNECFGGGNMVFNLGTTIFENQPQDYQVNIKMQYRIYNKWMTNYREPQRAACSSLNMLMLAN